MKRAQLVAGLSIAAIALAFPAMSDAPKAPPTKPVHVPHENNCTDMKISVYFSTQESMLSSYSMRALNTAGDQLAGCSVTNIHASVISADAKGADAAANLSEARAAVVLDALSARGIRARNVQTDFVPVADVPLPENTAFPMARRVDLTVRADKGYGL